MVEWFGSDARRFDGNWPGFACPPHSVVKAALVPRIRPLSGFIPIREIFPGTKPGARCLTFRNAIGADPEFEIPC
jgi:hypothetical protein